MAMRRTKVLEALRVKMDLTLLKDRDYDYNLAYIETFEGCNLLCKG